MRMRFFAIFAKIVESNSRWTASIKERKLKKAKDIFL